MFKFFQPDNLIIEKWKTL